MELILCVLHEVGQRTRTELEPTTKSQVVPLFADA